MAETYSIELTDVDSQPASKADGSVMGGRTRRRRATITMAAQASADTIVLVNDLYEGEHFAFGIITASATLATATVSVGRRSAPAEYRAAAVFTAVDTPTLFGKAAAVSGVANPTLEDVIATIGTAALPGAGTLVIDLYYTNG